MAWVKRLEYEVNIDDTKDIIEALLNDPMDPKAPYFWIYEEAKEIIELEIKLPQAFVKGINRIATLRQACSTLLLKKGKGDDVEEDNANDEDEETKSEEEDPIRKKGKVIITRPNKSSTIVFTRRVPKSRKKLKLGEEDAEQIIFKKIAPTLQEKLKELEEWTSMACFKFLKYESRNANEKRQIEDTIITKFGKWKYSLDELAQQIPNELMEAIKPRWEHAKNTTKDIFEHTLRKLKLSLSEKEVK